MTWQDVLVAVIGTIIFTVAGRNMFGRMVNRKNPCDSCSSDCKNASQCKEDKRLRK